MSDSFNAFKLHHPNYSTLHNNNSAPPKIIPFCICSHCTNLISFNHHHHHLGDDEGGSSRRRGLLHVQSQSESQHQSSSSRWSPTPAQLLVLEELYRQGTKTPTAEQIQQIASQLRRFGKIEGKNVFYWFQNHKARERQKRRRREMEEAAHHHHHPHSDDSPQDKQHPPETGLRGTGYEVKETKKWASSSNCSGLAEQEPVSSLLEIAESGPNNNGWSNKVQGTQVLKGITISSNNYNSQTKSSHNNSLNTETCTYCDDEEEEDDDDDEEEYANSRRTLELFPLKRDHQDGIFLKQRKSRFYASTNYSLGSEITSRQFFEFLPLKD